MSDTDTRDDEITRYVEAVRAALADLPETVRAELVEDLPTHLADVCAEPRACLSSRGIGRPRGPSPGQSSGRSPTLRRRQGEGLPTPTSPVS